MIIEVVIEGILGLLFNTFDKLLPVGIPGLSDEVMQHMYDYLDLFQYAKNFIVFFIPPNALKFGIDAVVLLFSVEKLYPLVIWVIKKIPFVNIQ